MAALCKCKYGTEVLGFALPCAVTLKPAIPEIIDHIQYGSTPQRLLLLRSDIEILTLFNDDLSFIRDDCTVW